LTENTEKERIFKGFSVNSVSSVYKNHGNSQRTSNTPNTHKHSTSCILLH
jgi:hypothetical protein